MWRNAMEIGTSRGGNTSLNASFDGGFSEAWLDDEEEDLYNFREAELPDKEKRIK